MSLGIYRSAEKLWLPILEQVGAGKLSRGFLVWAKGDEKLSLWQPAAWWSGQVLEGWRFCQGPGPGITVLVPLIDMGDPSSSRRGRSRLTAHSRLPLRCRLGTLVGVAPGGQPPARRAARAPAAAPGRRRGRGQPRVAAPPRPGARLAFMAPEAWRPAPSARCSWPTTTPPRRSWPRACRRWPSGRQPSGSPSSGKSSQP